jgi:hypothetical protein
MESRQAVQGEKVKLPSPKMEPTYFIGYIADKGLELKLALKLLRLIVSFGWVGQTTEKPKLDRD